MTAPIHTRVGTIVDGDNRFFGRSVFTHWAHQVTAASDPLLLALGLPAITDQGREVLRLLVLGSISPDARVWPLKLTRLLASHGDPLVGYFGAQLVSAGKIMGPGALVGAAQALAWIAGEVGDDGDDAAVARAVQLWRERAHNRIGGFGVPFRDVDERRTGILRLVGDGPLSRGRYWRLHLRVVAALHPLPPNIAITLAALVLDLGIAPEHAGIALAVCMSGNFLAHAVEAAAIDGARAHDLPRAAIRYTGAAPRATQTRTAIVPPPALRRRQPAGDDPPRGDSYQSNDPTT
ncbi:hypothetical protein [Nannocystis radixulma]|uniref:Citrate synthase (unknown stereospecificity) n=1 Tax=Nannocystis radixulma TaxID=2995305 RepID=A0ABT5B0R8_9BACT|nr:hypothetical protein [Nannocystis radixulma]MDC0667693.1 hypothetical protein [Nannocystis radixulma]